MDSILVWRFPEWWINWQRGGCSTPAELGVKEAVQVCNTRKMQAIAVNLDIRNSYRVMSCNICHNDLRKIIWSCLRNRAGAIQGLKSRTIGRLVTMKNICRLQSTTRIRHGTLVVNYCLYELCTRFVLLLPGKMVNIGYTDSWCQ